MEIVFQTVLLAAALTWAAPAFASDAEELFYVPVESAVTLAPTTRFEKPLRYVYWFTQNQDIAWHNPLSSWNYAQDGKWKDRLSVSADVALTIKKIEQEDFGTFTLQKLGPQTERILVKTYRLAKMNVSLNPASLLLPGETASLACDVETPQGHAKPEIYWLNPQGGKMARKEGVIGGKLAVRAARRHHGLWTCVVMSKGGRRQDKAAVFLNVLDLSPAASYQEYTSKSSPLAVPCSFTSDAPWEQIKAKGILGADWHFFPKPPSGPASEAPQRLFSLSGGETLEWKADRDKKLIPSANLQEGELSLGRRAGRVEDRGDYVCSVTFKGGVRINRTVRVDVLQIVSSPGPVLTSGEGFNLSCGFGRPLPPDLRLRWIPPELSSLPTPSADYPPACLAVPEAGWGDGGKWRCELWRNKTRLTSAEITLRIDPKLSVWMLVTICGGAVIVVLVLILAFILCRRRQRKTRHLKHRLCHCKNPKPKGFYRT